MPRERSAGDRKAGIVESLFRLYEQKMYRVAFAILHDEGQAEDAVIAAFEKVLKRGSVPRRPEGEKAARLMVAAVRSCAIDQYRKNARERTRTVLVGDVALVAPEAQAPSPIEESLESAHVQSLVDGLPDPYGDVLRERFLRDRTVRETAQSLGISESNVRKRQERALQMLREQKGGMSHELSCL